MKKYLVKIVNEFNETIVDGIVEAESVDDAIMEFMSIHCEYYDSENQSVIDDLGIYATEIEE